MSDVRDSVARSVINEAIIEIGRLADDLGSYSIRDTLNPGDISMIRVHARRAIAEVRAYYFLARFKCGSIDLARGENSNSYASLLEEVRFFENIARGFIPNFEGIYD